MDKTTHLERGLFIFISLLVGSSLGLIRATLLVVQSLPAQTQNLADLTKGDVGVLSANILTLLIGEEHVSRKTTLGTALYESVSRGCLLGHEM